MEIVPCSSFVVRLSLPQILNALFTFNIHDLSNLSIENTADCQFSFYSPVALWKEHLPPKSPTFVSRISFECGSSLLLVLVIPGFSSFSTSIKNLNSNAIGKGETTGFSAANFAELFFTPWKKCLKIDLHRLNSKQWAL